MKDGAKTAITGIILGFTILFVVSMLSNCATVRGTGNESLVEARIIAAVDAERNRWARELSEQLTAEIGEINRRVNSIAGGQEQTLAIAREYRQLFQRTIQRLRELEIGLPDAVESGKGSNLGTGSLDWP